MSFTPQDLTDLSQAYMNLVVALHGENKSDRTRVNEADTANRDLKAVIDRISRNNR